MHTRSTRKGMWARGTGRAWLLLACALVVVGGSGGPSSVDITEQWWDRGVRTVKIPKAKPLARFKREEGGWDYEEDEMDAVVDHAYKRAEMTVEESWGDLGARFRDRRLVKLGIECNQDGSIKPPERRPKGFEEPPGKLVMPKDKYDLLLEVFLDAARQEGALEPGEDPADIIKEFEERFEVKDFDLLPTGANGTDPTRWAMYPEQYEAALHNAPELADPEDKCIAELDVPCLGCLNSPGPEFVCGVNSTFLWHEYIDLFRAERKKNATSYSSEHVVVMEKAKYGFVRACFAIIKEHGNSTRGGPLSRRVCSKYLANYAKSYAEQADRLDIEDENTWGMRLNSDNEVVEAFSEADQFNEGLQKGRGFGGLAESDDVDDSETTERINLKAIKGAAGEGQEGRAEEKTKKKTKKGVFEQFGRVMTEAVGVAEKVFESQRQGKHKGGAEKHKGGADGKNQTAGAAAEKGEDEDSVKTQMKRDAERTPTSQAKAETSPRVPSRPMTYEQAFAAMEASKQAKQTHRPDAGPGADPKAATEPKTDARSKETWEPPSNVKSDDEDVDAGSWVNAEDYKGADSDDAADAGLGEAGKEEGGALEDDEALLAERFGKRRGKRVGGKEQTEEEDSSSSSDDAAGGREEEDGGGGGAGEDDETEVEVEDLSMIEGAERTDLWKDGELSSSSNEGESGSLGGSLGMVGGEERARLDDDDGHKAGRGDSMRGTDLGKRREKKEGGGKERGGLDTLSIDKKMQAVLLSKEKKEREAKKKAQEAGQVGSRGAGVDAGLGGGEDLSVEELEGPSRFDDEEGAEGGRNKKVYDDDDDDDGDILEAKYGKAVKGKVGDEGLGESESQTDDEDGAIPVISGFQKGMKISRLQSASGDGQMSDGNRRSKAEAGKASGTGNQKFPSRAEIFGGSDEDEDEDEDEDDISGGGSDSSERRGPLEYDEAADVGGDVVFQGREINMRNTAARLVTKGRKRKGSEVLDSDEDMNEELKRLEAGEEGERAPRVKSLEKEQTDDGASRDSDSDDDGDDEDEYDEAKDVEGQKEAEMESKLAKFVNHMLTKTRGRENDPKIKDRMMRELQAKYTRRGLGTQYGKIRFDEIGHNRDTTEFPDIDNIPEPDRKAITFNEAYVNKTRDELRRQESRVKRVMELHKRERLTDAAGNLIDLGPLHRKHGGENLMKAKAILEATTPITGDELIRASQPAAESGKSKQDGSKMIVDYYKGSVGAVRDGTIVVRNVKERAYSQTNNVVTVSDDDGIRRGIDPTPMWQRDDTAKGSNIAADQQSKAVRDLGFFGGLRGRAGRGSRGLEGIGKQLLGADEKEREMQSRADAAFRHAEAIVKKDYFETMGSPMQDLGATQRPSYERLEEDGMIVQHALGKQFAQDKPRRLNPKQRKKRKHIQMLARNNLPMDDTFMDQEFTDMYGDKAARHAGTPRSVIVDDKEQEPRVKKRTLKPPKWSRNEFFLNPPPNRPLGRGADSDDGTDTFQQYASSE